MRRRPPRRRWTARLFAGAAGLGLALAAAPVAPALAGPRSGPTAVVSMGDSYISGEAGRWLGNSFDLLPGSDGTDRACVPGLIICVADKSHVYVGGSAADGCHRSDLAEVASARLDVADQVNIAYAQLALGTCVTRLFAAAPGDHACLGAAGRAPDAMVLTG